MNTLFKLNETDILTVSFNKNKKVTITVGEEEINFFMGNIMHQESEAEYMNNFLMHRLAGSKAKEIYSHVMDVIQHGYYPKKKDLAYSHYFIRIHNKKWDVVFERTNIFLNKADAKKYAYDVIANTSDNSGMMKSRVKIRKV